MPVDSHALPRLTDIASAETAQQQIMDEVHSGLLSEKAELHAPLPRWMSARSLSAIR